MQAQRKEINLKKVDVVADECDTNGKYAIIWDKSGCCKEYFQYRSYFVDFEKEMHKVSLGTQTHLDACE